MNRRAVVLGCFAGVVAASMVLLTREVHRAPATTADHLPPKQQVVRIHGIDLPAPSADEPQAHSELPAPGVPAWVVPLATAPAELPSLEPRKPPELTGELAHLLQRR